MIDKLKHKIIENLITKGKGLIIFKTRLSTEAIDVFDTSNRSEQ